MFLHEAFESQGPLHPSKRSGKGASQLSNGHLDPDVFPAWPGPAQPEAVPVGAGPLCHPAPVTPASPRARGPGQGAEAAWLLGWPVGSESLLGARRRAGPWAGGWGGRHPPRQGGRARGRCPGGEQGGRPFRSSRRGPPPRVQQRRDKDTAIQAGGFCQVVTETESSRGSRETEAGAEAPPTPAPAPGLQGWELSGFPRENMHRQEEPSFRTATPPGIGRTTVPPVALVTVALVTAQCQSGRRARCLSHGARGRQY